MSPSGETALSRVARLAGQFFDVRLAAITGLEVDCPWWNPNRPESSPEVPRAALSWARSIPDCAPVEAPASSLPGIGFCAAAPIISSGVRRGTLVIVDPRARRPLGENELSLLRDFAALASQVAGPPRDAASLETTDWLALAQQAAGVGFWDWDMVNDICACSDQYFRLYGVEPRPSLSYREWQHLVHPDDRKPAPAGGFEDPYQTEFRCVWPDGSVHWLLSKARIVRDDSGRPVRMIGANVDVTPLREAVQRRRQAERELDASRGQLRQLAARAESAREEERIRIAREIHDELGQMLSVLKMDLGGIEAQCRESASRAVRELTSPIASMMSDLDRIISASRRISTELRPGVLDHLGIAAALLWQMDEFQARAGIRCQASGIPDELPLDAAQSTAVFRIFQEILTNIARHAGATAVTVGVRQRAGKFTLQVADNGRGFVREHMSDPDALGLLGMSERALLLGGTIEFDSCPGRGTTVTLQIPIPARQLAAARTNTEC